MRPIRFSARQRRHESRRHVSPALRIAAQDHGRSHANRLGLEAVDDPAAVDDRDVGSDASRQIERHFAHLQVLVLSTRELSAVVISDFLATVQDRAVDAESRRQASLNSARQSSGTRLAGGATWLTCEP